jgi:ribonuclease HI
MKDMQTTSAILHADGGARGNPGPAAGGAVLLTDEGEMIGEVADYCGETTSNVAEYRGLLAGLGLAYRKGITDLDVYLDSEVVVKQISGEFGVGSPMLGMLLNQVKDFMGRFSRCDIHQVRREQNAAADAVVNRCLDQFTQVEKRARDAGRRTKRILKTLGTLEKHVDGAGLEILRTLQDEITQLAQRHGPVDSETRQDLHKDS